MAIYVFAASASGRHFPYSIAGHSSQFVLNQLQCFPLPIIVQMPLPAQSTHAWHVSIGTLHIIAITSTLARLVHRRRRLDLWWDDWATILPLVCDFLYFVISRLQIQDKLRGAFFTSFWLECMLFLTIVWVSRTSLALSIARIFPPRHPGRRIAFSITGFCLLLWIAGSIKSGFDCYDSSSTEWWDIPLPLCMARHPTSKVGIFIFVACDFLADILLIVAPIAMLWGLKLPVVQRRLVFILFSCSFITLASSAFFIFLGMSPRAQLGPDVMLLQDMGPQLECAASIIVCNLMILATLIYRISKKNFASQAQAVKPPSPPAQQNVPPTATPVRAATGRSRDLLSRQNQVVITGDVVLSTTHRTDSTAQTSFTVPSFAYESSAPATGASTNLNSQHLQALEQTNPIHSDLAQSDPQFTNSHSRSLSLV